MAGTGPLVVTKCTRPLTTKERFLQKQTPRQKEVKTKGTMIVPEVISKKAIQGRLETCGFTKVKTNPISTIDKKQADEESKNLDFSGSLVSTAP